MSTKVVYAEIVDGRLVLPPEAKAILPSGTPLYMVVDTDKQRVTVYAKDLRKIPNEELLDSLADLNADMTTEEYTRPISDVDLRRPAASEDEGAK
jgi:hypothetical protein